MPRENRRRPAVGWLPRQHGAWFMLSLPVVVGWLLRVRDGAPAEPFLFAVVAAWLAGYLAFNAASAWLKSPARRRPAARAPVLVWTALASACGLVALAGLGGGLLGWAVPFAPLVSVALWLASARRERSVLGGALTVVAASLMVPVVRFVTPAALLAAWGTPAAGLALAHTALVFGYLFGTVLYVKTMIRERGSRTWLIASACWHAGCVAVAAALVALSAVGPGWPTLFAVVLARALLMPALAGRRTVRPMAVGLVEIGVTAAYVAVAAVG